MVSQIVGVFISKTKQRVDYEIPQIDTFVLSINIKFRDPTGSLLA